jgi:hypothetical protein
VKTTKNNDDNNNIDKSIENLTLQHKVQKSLWNTQESYMIGTGCNSHSIS